jgi:hypothetical protein
MVKKTTGRQMKEIDNKRFRAALFSLAAVYHISLTEPEIQQYWRSLNHNKVQIADFEWCVQLIMDGGLHKTDFMPKVPALCRYAKEAAEDYKENAPIVRVHCDTCKGTGYLWTKQHRPDIYGEGCAPITCVALCICGNAPIAVDGMQTYRDLIQQGHAAPEDFERIDHVKPLLPEGAI